MFLKFARECEQISEEQLCLCVIDRKFILNFLMWLETERRNGIATINQRLMAIHDFYKYLQAENPTEAFHAKKILAISYKKRKKPLMNYLIADDLKLLMNQPDISSKKGRRDLAILTILYDTGARVGEFINLKVKDVKFDAPSVIMLTEESGKNRNVPLMTNTVAILRLYMHENQLLNDAGKYDYPLFYNQQKVKMTRAGIAYILHKYSEMARNDNPELTYNITPNLLRNTKAMHLLQAGVDINYIRDILGHINTATTETYARADRKLKRKESIKAEFNTPQYELSKWNGEKDLLTWLNDA